MDFDLKKSLAMLSNPNLSYEKRVVGREDFDGNKGAVSTAYVTDTSMPYETAVAHPDFKYGEWIVVERYDNKADAIIGHTKWVRLHREDKLPDELKDANCPEAGTFLRGNKRRPNNG